MKVIKKLLVIMCLLTLVASSTPLINYLLNNTSNASKVTIQQFCEELNQLNKKYAEEPVSNRLIVKSKHDIPILDGVAIVEGYNGLHIVQFDNGESARKALEYYNNNNLIEYAQEDFVVGVAEAGITYDKHLSWGSEVIGVDDYVDYLGDVEALPEVVVGIIDTGIDIDHEFLEDRVIETHFNISESGESNSEDDDNGHGSHVAGIIVDNTTDNIKIKGYKVLSDTGQGTTIEVISAIYAAADEEVDVINMSLGGQGNDMAMVEAINYAVQKGIVVCVSAGNSGSDAKKYIPASIEECITVSAYDAYYNKPYWANWGDAVDIAAPGVDIYSCIKDNKYRSLSGTSMSCPFVSAASALLKSKNKTLTCDGVCSILQENGKEWVPEESKDIIDSLYGIKSLYIGNITTFESPRTDRPVFNMHSGNYTEPFYLEITALDTSAEIYYTLDGTRAERDNGILYTEPILIDKITSVHAVAYSEGKLKSLQANAIYYLTSQDVESNFVINENGIITKYLGSNKFLTIPNTINGITVTGIGDKVFRRKNIVMVKCPDTLTYVGKQAFYFAQNLYSFDCSNLQTVEQESFYRCDALTRIDLTNITSMGKAAFYHCVSISAIYNDKLTEVSQQGFVNCNGAVYIELPNVTKVNVSSFAGCFYIEAIKLPHLETASVSAFASCCNLREAAFPNLTSIEQPENAFGGIFGHCSMLTEVSFPNLEGLLPSRAFEYCTNLKTVYLPKVTRIATYCFTETTIKTLFVPNASRINSLPNYSTMVYSGGDFINEDYSVARKDYDYDYRIIAPAGSEIEQWANENGYNFTDSDTMVDAVGTHTEGNGNTVFEFGWKNIDEIEQYASEIIYGANNIPPMAVTDGKTYFSVTSNEPSMRGCVDIDGMLFRSASLAADSHENELEPDNGCEHEWQIVYTVSVPDDTVVVFRCDECGSYYRVSFMEHINTDYPLLDQNSDNIINAKDYAIIVRTYPNLEEKSS